MQFEDIADHHQWSYHVKLGKLKELFQDDALIYYSRLSRDICNSYLQLCEKMNMQFDQKDMPQAAQNQLGVITQQEDKALEVLAEYCTSIALDAWGHESTYASETEAIHTFLRGAHEAEGGLSVMDQSPRSMSDALSMMHEAISNCQTTAKVRKSGGTEEDGLIHQVTFPDTSENTDEMICQLCNKPSGNPVSFQDTKIKDLEEKVESLSQSINNMLKFNYPQSPLRPYPS